MDGTNLDQEEREEDEWQTKSDGVETREDRTAKRTRFGECKSLHSSECWPDTWGPSETEEETEKRRSDDSLYARRCDLEASIELLAEDEDDSKKNRDDAQDASEEFTIAKESRSQGSEDHAVGDEERSETKDEEDRP